MRRRLFTLTSALSVLLCMALLGVWGHAGAHSLSWGKSPRYSIAFNDHALVLTRDRVVSDDAVDAQIQRLHLLVPVATLDRNDYILGGRAR